MAGEFSQFFVSFNFLFLLMLIVSTVYIHTEQKKQNTVHPKHPRIKPEHSKYQSKKIRSER